MKLPGVPNIKKVQANLVHIAYSVYCFGYRHGSEKSERWSYAKFCQGIKVAHEEGAKLWDISKAPESAFDDRKNPKGF